MDDVSAALEACDAVRKRAVGSLVAGVAANPLVGPSSARTEHDDRCAVLSYYLEAEIPIEAERDLVVDVDAQAHSWVLYEKLHEEPASDALSSPRHFDGHAEFGNVVGDEAVTRIGLPHSPAPGCSDQPEWRLCNLGVVVVPAEIHQVVSDVRRVEYGRRKRGVAGADVQGLVQHRPEKADVGS